MTFLEASFCLSPESSDRASWSAASGWLFRRGSYRLQLLLEVQLAAGDELYLRAPVVPELLEHLPRLAQSCAQARLVAPVRVLVYVSSFRPVAIAVPLSRS